MNLVKFIITVPDKFPVMFTTLLQSGIEINCPAGKRKVTQFFTTRSTLPEKKPIYKERQQTTDKRRVFSAITG